MRPSRELGRGAVAAVARGRLQSEGAAPRALSILGVAGASSPSRLCTLSGFSRRRTASHSTNDRVRSTAVVNRPQQVSADPEEILYHAMDGREALHVGSRLKVAHLALALPDRMRGRPVVLCDVVVRNGATPRVLVV